MTSHLANFMNLTLSQINVYPVKSCRGLSLSESKIGLTGFLHDREWLVVNQSGQFVTQRQIPKMALIKPIILPSGVKLEAPGLKPIEVPIIEGVSGRVEIWESVCQAVDQGPAISHWLSQFLGQESHLVRMAPDFKRKVKEKYQVTGEEVVDFADGFPFLLISQSSLDDLNSKLKNPVPMNRFRPNLVVEGGNPFQEDGWKKVKVGGVLFRVAKPCARCEITTVDQDTGEKGIEPLETLGLYRTAAKGVMFGQNLIAESLGTVKVGDPVEVVE